jgi:hypothetical protein
MIPSINTRAKFTFLPPFDTLAKNQEFTVISIRSIPDLNSNGINVISLVYEVVGLTEVDYNQDLENNIPIITFITDSNILINVPSSKVSGVSADEYKYQEKVLTVNLPALPVDYDLTSLRNSIAVLVKEQIGFDVNIEEVQMSAVSLVGETDHLQFMNILNSGGLDKRSYLTKYLEILEIHNNQNLVFNKLEEFVKKIKNEGI